MRALAALIAVLALLAQTSAAAFPLGLWFGQGEPGDDTEMWLARVVPGGQFQVQFRSCHGKQARDSIETGHWSLKGDIETIDIARVNGRPEPREDVYRILSHDARTQSYRFIKTGFFYKSVLVDGSFELPPCGLTS